MGIGQSMRAGMKKNMEEQMKFQKELILKQRQLQMATQVALGRERFWYYSNFYYVTSAFLLLGFFKSRDPRLLGPLIPLSFAYAFQYDMCYGDMMERAIATSDDLLVNNRLKFILPEHSGIVTREEYLRIVGLSEVGKQNEKL